MSQSHRPDESAFESAFATAVVGADLVWGGDIGVPSGRARFIADQWTSEQPLPSIYRHPTASVLRKNGGMSGPKSTERDEAVATLIFENQLLDAPREAIQQAASFEADRRAVIERLMHSMRLMIATAFTLATNRQPPSYEERYLATAGEHPRIFDPAEDCEKLRAALAARGFEVTPSRNLAETTEAWRDALGFIPPEKLEAEVKRVQAELIDQTRKKIFPLVDFGDFSHGAHLETVDFGGWDFRAVKDLPPHVTGAITFIGGEDAHGTPLLQGLFEYNLHHPMTALDLLHVVAHEGVPGHYGNAAIIDLLRRSGRLGFEASVATMCTSEVAFHEGWAQVWLELLYGSREALIEALGPDWEIQFATEDLQDRAKNNVGILHQVQGVSVDDIKVSLRDDYALPHYYIDKMARGWTQHPILGPMYGPAYLVGGNVLRDAIRRRGVAHVAKIGLHTEGMVDLEGFRQKAA